MSNILIVGMGYVGLELAKQLMNNHQVTGICRNHKQTDCQLILKDIHSLTPEDIPNDLDYVFYMVSADSRSPNHYQLAYPKGVEKILQCLKSQALKRFFYVSSTGVYPDGLQVQDENAELVPNTEYASLLLQAETIVLDAPIPSTVVRFGGLYGPGRTRMLDKVRNQALSLSDKPIFTNRIHQADAVGILCHLMTLKNLETIYNAVDNCVVEYNDVIKWLAKQIGVPLSDKAVSLNRPSKKISNQRLLASGYQFKFPSYQEGYAALLNQ